MLVGGTALAGFYAGHRRSDDLDLFVRDSDTFDRLRRRVRSLADLGAEIRENHASPGFSRATAVLRGHEFTVDVVVDANLFQVGRAVSTGAIRVATLETLLMTKAATLVSRCSEKDLYDLWWMRTQGLSLDPGELVRLGSQIDAGVEAESILIALSGVEPSRDACGFALPGGPNAALILKRVVGLQRDLQRALGDYLEQLPPPPLARSLHQLKRIK